MSGWVPIDKDLLDDPRVIELAMWFSNRYILAKHTVDSGTDDLRGPERMFAARYCVTGALVTLWRYADEHLREDDSLPLTLDALDALIGLEGFCAAMPHSWLIERDDRCVVLPGYCEKTSLITKRKRAAEAKDRMAARRAREKRNAEQIHNNTHTNTERSGERSIERSREHSENILRKTETETKTETEDKREEKTLSSTSSTANGHGNPKPVVAVFDHWRTTYKHPKAILDAKRKRVLESALKHYSPEFLCESLSGYLSSAFHMGDNPDKKVHDEITLLLRDSEHIERGIQFGQGKKVTQWE